MAKQSSIENPKSKTKKKTSKSSVNVLHGVSPYVISKGEEYMNEKQQEHFKLILKAWRLELMEEVDRTVSPYER